MFGALSSRFWGMNAFKTMWLFLTRSLAWKRVFAIFLHGGTTCLWKWKIELFWHSRCVVETSSSSLNHDMKLESKESYPRHTKTVQNSLGFMPEAKALHKPRGDLVLCVLKIFSPPAWTWSDTMSLHVRFDPVILHLHTPTRRLCVFPRIVNNTSVPILPDKPHTVTSHRPILERGITVIHPNSRNKYDYTDFINFSCCFCNRLVEK